MKKRDNKRKTAIAVMGLLLFAALFAALAGVFISWYGVPGDKSSIKHGTVRGSILSDVPSTITVSEPEPEPVEEMDPEIKKTISEAGTEELLEDSKEEVRVDIIVFAGQSNMSGYGGNAEEAPAVKEGAGAEFRSVSDPTRLYSVVEPFGIFENTEIMNDFYMKKGSLVSSFINTWYEETGTPVIAVSASKGGMSSVYWASEAASNEVTDRFKRTKEYLENSGYTVGNQFLVFLQGESDVLENIPDEQYLTDINVFSSKLFMSGIDKFFIIRIGGEKGKHDAFKRIADLQTELCRTDPRFVLVSTLLSGVGDDHMVDKYHYDQAVLNLLGADAARNGAYFAKTRRDPEIKDIFTGEDYVPVIYDGI